MTGIKLRITREKDADDACDAGREVARSIGLLESMEACLVSTIRRLTRHALEDPAGGTLLLRDESDAEHVRLRLALKGDGEGIRISHPR